MNSIHTRLILPLFLLLLAAAPTRAQIAEVEPNNSQATAHHVPYAATIIGQVSCVAGDDNDYFRVVMPAGMKSLRLIMKSKTVSGTGSMYYYLYNKYGSQLTVDYQSGLTTAWFTDTLDYPCFEGDTFFVRAYNWSGGCKDYEITTGTPAVFLAGADPEVNDDFAAATALVFNFDTSGHLASQRYGASGAYTDVHDYYRVVPPTGNKGLRVVTQWRTATPGGTGTGYVYLYNKFQQQLANNYVTGLTNAWKADTLDYPCFEGDTFYVRLYDWSGACKEYRIRASSPGVYTVSNDVENNDAFTSAVPIPWASDSSGHLANQRYGPATSYTDVNDYYRLIAPAGNKGIRIVTQWRAATPGGTGSAYVYLYNKFQQQLVNNYVVGVNNTWKSDTLNYPCFEGDTFYVRMYDWTGGCKEYRMRAASPGVYTVSNDVEVNDNFANANTIPWATDSSGHLASQRYSATGAYTDFNDYYRIVAPVGNRSLRLVTQWRTATPGGTGTAYVYLYNKFYQELANNYVAGISNSWKADTLNYPCFEGDTFYVRMYDWTGACKEYKYNAGSASIFLAGSDPENNDDFASATVLAFNTDTSGHIANQRYGPTTSYIDLNDYYRIVAPAGNRSLRLITKWRTAAPGATGTAYVYIYNKAQQQLANNYVGSITNAWKSDTLDFPCFEGDTFYVRMYDWSGSCKEYRVRPTTTGFFGFAGDLEPNSTLATATTLPFRTTTTGTLATQIYLPGSITTDLNDYYRVVMPNNDRGIRAIVNARMATPGATGTFYLYLYNKAGTQLVNKYITASSTLKADTLEFPCFNSDTFYVRIYDWSGDCKEYSLRTEYSANGPIHSAFERTRFGSSFSFVNRSRNATSYLWTFGDGSTDTTAYPVHTYGAGLHPVRLRATGFCGMMNSHDTLKVEGIEYYSPKTAGTDNGYGLFNVRVFGAGLDSMAEVKLTKGGTVLQPTKRLSPSTKELTAFFNLADVDTGRYDVSIRLSNGQVFSYPEGFGIFEDVPGVGISTKITGPNNVRTGTNTNFSLVVQNKKSRMANGVMVFIAVPRNVETNIKDILRKRTGKLRVEGAGYNALTIPQDFYDKVYYGGEFNPDVDIIEQDFDALYQAFDEMVSIDVETLLGQPYHGTIYPILIPAIAGKSTWTLSFKVKTPSNGGYPIMSYAWPFTLRQNPMSGESLDYIHDAGMNAASLAELSPHPALKAVGKAAGYIDIGSQVLFAEGVDWWYGTNTADEAFYGRQGVALTGELAGELLPTGSNINSARATIRESKDQIARRSKNVMMDFELLETSSPYYRRQLQENLIELSKRLGESEDLLSRAQKAEIVNSVIHLLAKKGINLTQEEIAERLFPEDVNRKPTNSVTSLDPNAIYGNAGPKPQQYLRRADVLSYLVTFENVDTALAPAAIVRVETQLDTNKFDVSRSYLGNVTIGDKLYLVEPDRREYFRDIDLRPAQNLIVRVNAHMDSTGRAYWEFTSLDPATMDVPEDPMIGFLPPNVNKPQGEGSVSFFTHLKPSVQNRDTFSAMAKIFFDANDPIETNRWGNAVDEAIPTTTLSPTVFLTDDSVMHLSLAGDDAESGVEQYVVFMKVDTAWEAYPYRFFAGGDASITGRPGHTYSFYAVAKDSVGNRQNKPQVAEATITLPARVIPDEPTGDGLAIYPNPARNTVTVSLGASDEGTLTLTFTTSSGTRALEWNTEHPGGPARYTVPFGSLAPGVYFLKAAIGSKVIGEARLVVIP